MTSEKLFHVIARVHLGIGALLGCVGAAMLIPALAKAFLEEIDIWKGISVIAISAIYCLVAIVIFQGARKHQNSPTRKTAQELAVGSSVGGYLFLTLAWEKSGAKALTMPYGVFVPITAALLVYFLLLKPAAIRAFPDS